MKPFDAISLDMFQTLVDFGSRKDNIWKALLGEAYDAGRSPELSRQVLDLVHEQMRQDHADFPTMEAIFASSFADCFKTNQMLHDHLHATELMLAEHRLAAVYPDVERFLQAALGTYKIYIVSDADDVMIPAAFTGTPYVLLTSERHQSYKNDRHNRMFKQLLQENGLSPERVLHIGDSAGDVLGAKREGIKGCWLNRESRTWKHDVQPDYAVTSMDELHELLFS